MILIDAPTSCLNWELVDREKFPENFQNSQVEEDFQLLFQENMGDSTKLKETLRCSTRDPGQAVRKFLWKRILLAQQNANGNDDIIITASKYEQKTAVLFGKNLTLKAELPDFVDKKHLVYYYLNEAGRAACGRILNLLATTHPDITFAPLLLPLTSLFLHYMSEPECYACLLIVVESKNKITETDIHWKTTNQVFRRYAHKYSRDAYSYLCANLECFSFVNDNDDEDEYSGSEEEEEEEEDDDVDVETSFEVTGQWLWWIFEYLPFNYVLNVVDLYLLEGTKVLYRFGIAILETFHKHHVSMLQRQQQQQLQQPGQHSLYAHIIHTINYNHHLQQKPSTTSTSSSESSTTSSSSSTSSSENSDSSTNNNSSPLPLTQSQSPDNPSSASSSSLRLSAVSKSLKPDCVKLYCQNYVINSEEYEKIVRVAFGYRNMARKDIEQAFQAEEKMIKKTRRNASDSSHQTQQLHQNQQRQLHLLQKQQQKEKEKHQLQHLGMKKRIASSVFGSLFNNNSNSSSTQDLRQSSTRSKKNDNENEGRSKKEGGVIQSPDIDNILIDSPSAASTTKSSLSSTSKSFRQKKWYQLQNNQSNHSLFCQHHSHHHQPQAVTLRMPSFSVENTGSQILTPEQITTIWRWLPTRYQLHEIQLVYSTNIHGCRLMTLFDKIEFYPSSFVVILTTTNAVFGAFCSQPWSDRMNQRGPDGKILRYPRYFGNGETFLFELKPDVKKYEWVGKKLHGDCVASQELFMFANREKLIIGGPSEKFSGVGLLVNDDLIYGRTSKSDTFDNEPLGTEHDFEISVLEVFSFTGN